jgi:hypothetical protein
LKLRIIAVDITADFASPSMTIEEFWQCTYWWQWMPSVHGFQTTFTCVQSSSQKKTFIRKKTICIVDGPGCSSIEAKPHPETLFWCHQIRTAQPYRLLYNPSVIRITTRNQNNARSLSSGVKRENNCPTDAPQ